MSQPALILFDDRTARDWQPFTLTRPAGELRFGTFIQRERAETVFDAPCLGHVTDELLRPFDEPGAPPVLDPGGLPRDRDVVYLSSRAVPGWQNLPEFGAGSELIAVDGEVCGWYAPAGTESPPAAFFLDPGGEAPDRLRVRGMDGRLLRHVWDLVAHVADQLTRDIAAGPSGAADRSGSRVGGGQDARAHSASAEPDRSGLPAGVHVVGSAALVLGDDVAIDPGVVLDLRDGPIRLDDGARIHAFTRLTGPAYIGRGSTLLGGSFAAVSVGPRCKVHGEMEETVVLGYSNKAHDGFLGHAYLGCWVNLGALTTNSDLKNNYGPVRIWTPHGMTDTGETKLGCFIGDHVKTAIGTMLTTGTVVGAGANIFGPASPARYVPPFAWGTGEGAAAYELDRFLETAEIVMGRRDVRLTAGQRTLLEAAWRHGRSERPA